MFRNGKMHSIFINVEGLHLAYFCFHFLKEACVEIYCEEKKERR